MQRRVIIVVGLALVLAAGVWALATRSDDPTVYAQVRTGPVTTAAGVGAPGSEPGMSRVPPLSVAEVRAVVAMPRTARARTNGTVSAERVTVPSVPGDAAGRSAGRVVLVIRVAGRQPVRAERAQFLADGQPLGPAFVTPGADALVAVVVDPGSVADGAALAYRFGQGPDVPVGTVRLPS